MQSQKRMGVIVLLGAVVLLSGRHGWAAAPAHLTLVGESQGVIQGSCTLEGREGSIVVYSFGHNVAIPTDPASGLPTGGRTHHPMKVLKEIDKSSPNLYRALCTGERLREVKLMFYRLDPISRMEQVYFTIVLENALITSITPSFPTAFLSQNESYRHMETVSFNYQKITWKWIADGIEFQDSWGVIRE
jgi:type VI secretion system secreted protein Hcp